MKKDFPVRFTGEKWIIDVRLLMSSETLKNVCRWISNTQKDRLKNCTPFSQKYENILTSIAAADNFKIEQRLVDEFGGTKGDLVAFSATRDDVKKIYVHS